MISVSPDQVDLLLVVLCKDGRNTVEALAAARARERSQILLDVAYLKELGLLKGDEELEFSVEGYTKVLLDWFAEVQELKLEEKLVCEEIMKREDFQLMLGSLAVVQGKMLADAADGRTWFGFGGVNRKTFKEMFITPVTMLMALTRLGEAQFPTLTFQILGEAKKVAGVDGILLSTSVLTNFGNLESLRKFQKFYPRALAPVAKLFGM